MATSAAGARVAKEKVLYNVEETLLMDPFVLLAPPILAAVAVAHVKNMDEIAKDIRYAGNYFYSYFRSYWLSKRATSCAIYLS
jgi:hypothetical protein